MTGRIPAPPVLPMGPAVLLPLLLLFSVIPPVTGQVPSVRPLEIQLHDANPALTGGQYLAAWGPDRLATVHHPRLGAATDGVSRLLVRVETPGPGTVTLELMRPDTGNGTLAGLTGGESVRVGDTFLSFALYTPPAHFGPRSRADGQWDDTVDFRGVSIQARFTGADGRVLEAGSAIILVRPPLVLVHGTFDNPVAAWRTESELGPAPVKAFSDAGFLPFTVDYSGSSGAPAAARTPEGGRISQSWLNPGESSFRANRRVVLDHPGGIRSALEYYRSELGFAAAQADVVGHSLGGMLGRVLASPEYNPDYRTPENFNEGWINRLITLSTPHHGTELPAMMSFFQEAEGMDGRTWTEWFLSKSIRLGGWWAGRSASAANAVRDQLPLSDALQAIGPTDVPSHAVVGTMDYSRLQDDGPTQALFTGVAVAFYHFPGLFSDFLSYLARERDSLPPQHRMTTSVDGTPAPWPVNPPGEYEELLRGLVLEPFDREAEFWLARRDEGWIQTVQGIASKPQVPPGFLDTGFGEDPSEYGILRDLTLGGEATRELGVALSQPTRLMDQVVPLPLIDQFRDLIFRNDLNDGTVRLGSQTGSLDARYFTRIETPVVHSVSPRYPTAQKAIIEVLHAGGEHMAPGGFPRAGQQLPVWLPSQRLTRTYVEGEDAICWSGMVYDHALAYAAVADSADAIILARPVNPDATTLIARNAATKGMAVKGKSASWGPQVGFIPVQQRFSKLWRVWTGSRRAAEIDKYDKEVKGIVDKGIVVSRELQLTLEAEPGVVYRVYEDTLQRSNAEDAIHLVRGEAGSLQRCDWRTEGREFSRRVPPSSCEPIPSTDGWRLLEVLADPASKDANGEPRYLTADYDLLAIGFRDPPLPQPYLLHSFLRDHFLNDQGERKVPGMILLKRDRTADTLRFDGKEGFITGQQSALVDAMNGRVWATGYVAGKVTHHGPENNYSGSPYVDYPITAFEPSGDGRGRIVAIPMGPAGFRDIHLKRYFLRKRQEGYNLVPNPEAEGWRWHDWGEYSAVTGWDPRDARTLPSYPAELAMPETCVPVRQMPDEPLAPPDDSAPELPPLEPILDVRTDAQPEPGREPPPRPVADPSTAGAAPSVTPSASSHYLVTDDLVAYFQPARDTTETVWQWRIVRVDATGDTAQADFGLFTPAGGELDTTHRAEPGASAAFRAALDLLWREGGPGPGTYLLQTCLPKAVPGLFGQTMDWAGCLRPFVDQGTGEAEPLLPWQDEGSFEVEDVSLHLKGVVAEEGSVLFDAGDPKQGRYSLEPPDLDAAGASVVLRVEMDLCMSPQHPGRHSFPPCEEIGPDWSLQPDVDRIQLTADVPRILNLRERVPASFQLSVTTLQGDRPASVQIHDLFPRSGGPHRELAALSGGALMDVRAGRQPQPRGSEGSLRPQRMWAGSEPSWVHFHTWYTGRAGEPPRPVGEWIRDPSAHWFVPVEFIVAERKIFAFLVYGPEPGPYDGPVPTAPGSVGGAPGDRTGVMAGDPARGAEPPGGIPPADPQLGRGGRTVDPAALDPSSLEVSGLIREWIAVARPPQSAEPDNHYVYDEWGRVVGSGADGIITGGAPPEGRGALGSVGYVWTLRDRLDSVDHCTLGEYVVRSLEARDMADCRGRYRPTEEREPAGRTVVSVYGLLFQDAKAILADSGFVVTGPVGGDPAPAEDMAYRVASQSVSGGQARSAGTEIRLTIYGPFRPDAARQRVDPPAPPPQDTGPSCNDLVMAANRAQGRGDLSGAGELYRTALRHGCRNPGLAEAMESVYQSPRCTELIRGARASYDRNDFQSAIRSLRSAEREGCDMSGLGPLIDGTLTALETGVAETLGRGCSSIAADIAAARQRGDEGTAQALATTALLQGCSGDEITTAATTPLGGQAGVSQVGGGTGRVRLTQPQGGLVTRERVIPVAGEVTDPRAQRVTLVVNGEERTLSVQEGRFETMVPLVTGQNTIQAFLSPTAYSQRVTVQADVAPADVWIQLTWDGPGDIDLHLYLPNGEHVYYSNKQSAAGARLDVDNTRQDGPEHITMTRAIPGEYRVAVRYFGRGIRPSGSPVPWQVLVRLNRGQTAQRFTGVLNSLEEEVVVYTFSFR